MQPRKIYKFKVTGVECQFLHIPDYHINRYRFKSLCIYLQAEPDNIETAGILNNSIKHKYRYFFLIETLHLPVIF